MKDAFGVEISKVSQSTKDKLKGAGAVAAVGAAGAVGAAKFPAVGEKLAANGKNMFLRPIKQGDMFARRAYKSTPASRLRDRTKTPRPGKSY